MIMKNYPFKFSLPTCMAILISFIGTLMVGCNDPYQYRIPEQPYEIITGKITDDNGFPLKGIRVASSFGADYIDCYSDTSGVYHIMEVSLYYKGFCGQTRDVHLTATAPSGVYATQKLDTQMVYNQSNYSGYLENINFTMTKETQVSD